MRKCISFYIKSGWTVSSSKLGNSAGRKREDAFSKEAISSLFSSMYDAASKVPLVALLVLLAGGMCMPR